MCVLIFIRVRDKSLLLFDRILENRFVFKNVMLVSLVKEEKLFFFIGVFFVFLRDFKYILRIYGDRVRFLYLRYFVSSSNGKSERVFLGFLILF